MSRNAQGRTEPYRQQVYKADLWRKSTQENIKVCAHEKKCIQMQYLAWF